MRVALGAVLLAVLLFGGTAFRVWQVARVDDRQPADVIVVLGAAQYDGRPSDVFSARLRHAKGLFDEGISDNVITVGGRRPKDTYTEAEAGDKYLVFRGVPSDRIVTVNAGSDTLGSLRAVSARMHERGWHTAVLVSDPWHSLRSRMMARDFGIDAWTSPTHSGPAVQTRQTQFRNIIRESAGALYYRLTRASAAEVDTALP
ncbi:MAG: YdcF family protein [Sciscionella sp.]